jgi:uncharacterized glyoxalase superfamily protein PhnB
VARTCEPGVGGRLLEVYDEASGDALELGRITVWQPGERLAWQSAVDDVLIDVRFEPTTAGTMVRVLASIPDGGQDRGGTAWVRVVPPWFGAWCARRDTAPRQPQELARLAVAVYYSKPVTAARWLTAAFGLQMPSPLPAGDAAGGEDGEDGEDRWIEFRVGNSSLILFRLQGERPEGAADTHVPWVFVDDLDAHLARAKASGAGIDEGIHAHGYRAYVARDLEGHCWTFAQAPPSMR